MDMIKLNMLMDTRQLKYIAIFIKNIFGNAQTFTKKPPGVKNAPPLKEQMIIDEQPPNI